MPQFSGGLDTNVLVRYLVEDDPIQAEAARRYIEEQCSVDRPALVHPVTLCELVWVLRAAYNVPRQRIAKAIDALLDTPNLYIMEAELVRRALQLFRSSSVDFADAYQHVAYHIVSGKSWCMRESAGASQCASSPE